MLLSTIAVSENFTVTLANPSNATLGTSTATGTIIDNDVIPTVSIGDVTVTEGGNASFTVTLSAVSGLPVSVDWATADSTATAGTDYTAASNTLTIPAGTGSASIVVVTSDDSIDEADETFSVNLSNPGNSTIGVSTGTATVVDNDPLPVLSINDVTVNEGDLASFTVSLSPVSSRDVSFNWVTQDNTATNPGDYNSNSGSVTIPGGSTTVSLDVTTVENATYESSETFRIQISSPGNAVIGDDIGVGTINDDDGVPSLSINDVGVTEGGTATFTVSLTGATELTTTVNWTTANGTAISPDDYTFNSGSLSFTPGETTKTIDVVTIDDSSDEAAQTFSVTLSGENNATVADASGVATISDNDSNPSISIADGSATEGGGVSFLVSLSAASEQDVTVDWATADNTAVSPADFTAASGTLTILAGDTSGTINVSTADDAISELSEDFVVNLSNPGNATISDASGTGTITDNDGSPQLSVNDVSVAEGSAVSFTITASKVSSQNITVDYATSDGTAVAGSDYTAVSGTATILAGSTTTTVNVTSLDNGVFEISETYTLTLSNPANATISDATGIGTITDNDTQPTLAIDDPTGTEGGNVVFTVTKSGSTQESVSVNWATSDGTAVAPGDYSATSGTLIIASGDSTGTISIPAIDDSVDEPDQTIQITLSGATLSTISDTTGVGTITDNDAAPTVSIGDALVDESVGTANLSVTLSAASEKSISVNWATADNTAVAPDDYTSNSGTLNFAVGETSKTVGVAIINDSVDENGEGLSVSLSGPSNVTVADGTGDISITDNDTAALSINDVAENEGDSLTFTISIDRTSVNNVSVNWSTSNGTAVAPTDFTANSGTATINAGLLSTTVVVNTSEDTTYELNETFTVTLSGPVNATITDASGAGTINNDDAAPTLSIDDPTVTEGGTLNYTITLTGTTAVDTVFDWAASNGTAVAPGDYSAASGTSVTITAGSTTKVVTVSTLDDGLDESDETVNVTLSNPSHATFSDNVGIGTITDNDTLPTLSIADVSVQEGTATVTFTITANTTSGRDMSVDWTTSNGTATGGSDFTADSGTLIILAGQTTGTIVISISDDSTVCEIGETFSIVLSNPVDAVIGDSTAIATISDNEPSLSLVGPTVAESGTATFTVNMSGTCGQDVTFDWATANGTAIAPGDFTAGSGTGTITAATTSTTFDVTLNDDSLSELSEAFSATISNPTNAVILTATANATITDNDTVPNISINDSTIVEGNTASFTVSLNTAAGSNITVDYATVDVSAVAGAGDYTAASGTATITAGSTTATINITTANDNVDEIDETFNVVISNPNLGTITDNTGVATLQDNDAIPNLSISDVSQNEGLSAVFTVSMDRPSYQDVTFDWATSDVSALSGSDYTASSGAGVTISAGSTSTTVNVTLSEDAVWEPSETFHVTLSNPSNAAIVDSTGVGTITEDDAVPTLSVGDVSIAEGGVAAFTVSLSGPLSQAVTFDWATSDDSAASGSDYTSASNTSETITAGSTSKVINITTLDDSLYEGDESFDLTITNVGVATLSDGLAVGTITENDSKPTVSIADAVAVTEGAVASFTVTLSTAAGVSTNINYSTSDGTAVAASDYTSVSSSLVIGAGQVTGTINVTTIDDSVIDSSATENFTVTLDLADNATISDGSGAGSINDNEPVRVHGSLVSGGSITNYKMAPDSSKVVFLGDIDTDETFELYSSNPDGSGFAKISGGLVSGGDVIDFAMSSDSSKVVFIADKDVNDDMEIYSVDLDGSNLVQLNGSLISGGDVQQFLISANSSKVVYLADEDTDGKNELYSVDLDGSNQQSISGGIVAGGNVTTFDISANSTTVVFIADASTDEDFELHSVSVSGGAVTVINDALVSGGDVTDFKISSDSSMVVFLADASTDGVFELFSDAIGGGVDNAVSGAMTSGGNVVSFALSADSSKVVYLADENADEDFELVSVNMSGSSAVVLNGSLVSSGDVTGFKISSDSSRVVYRADEDTDEVFELYSVTLSGTGATKLNGALVSGGDVASFDLTANSSRVVYLADQGTDGLMELYSAPLAGGGETKISAALVAGGDVSQFVLSPDSSKVLYLADKDINDDVELFDVAISGGASTQVSADLPSGGDITGMKISPDSSRVFYLGDQRVDTVIELFSEAL